MPSELRHFACTSCGRCCERGPEMELGEAAALADTFIFSLLFKVHSLPTGDRSAWAEQWWRDRESRIPLRPALEEARRHLGAFAARKRMDKQRDRQIFLDISAIAQDDGRGHCPALQGGLCTIYAIRPQTCRTVPLHYSRAPSTLQAYLDRFTASPGYKCETGVAAPAILDGNRVVDSQLEQARDRGLAYAKADRLWKDRILALMEDDHRAAASGLPTYDAVLSNSDHGYATLLPMLVAWRVAATEGMIPRDMFVEICQKQALLIDEKITLAAAGPPKDLLDALALYKSELATRYSPLLHQRVR